jgi:hypothetical protein
MIRRSSGSRILDRHYESEGWTIIPAGSEPPKSTGSRLYDRTVAGLNRGDRTQRAAGGEVKA